MGRPCFLLCSQPAGPAAGKASQTFPSQAFYKLLSKSPATAKPGLSSKQYHAALSGLADVVTEDLPAVVIGCEIPLSVGGLEFEVAGVDDEQPLPPSAKLRRTSTPDAPPTAPTALSATRVVGAGPEPFDIDGDGPETQRRQPSSSSTVVEPWPAGVPTAIFGQRVRYEPSVPKRYKARLRVSCDNPGHLHCERSRSLSLCVAEFGIRAAEAYLGAWLKASFNMTPADHCEYQPTCQDMAQYLSASNS